MRSPRGSARCARHECRGAARGRRGERQRGTGVRRVARVDTMLPVERAGLDRLSLPPDSRRRVVQDLDAGYAVVVPVAKATPVDAWWRIDTASGRALESAATGGPEPGRARVPDEARGHVLAIVSVRVRPLPDVSAGRQLAASDSTRSCSAAGIRAGRSPPRNRSTRWRSRTPIITCAWCRRSRWGSSRRCRCS